MKLSETPWPAVAEAAVDLALVPVGSTEQHGPHAALGTDLVIANAIAEGAHDRVEPPVALAPGVPVGVSEEHRAFAGSLWVRQSTMIAYLTDIAQSLAHHGVEAVVFVNGHGGNTATIAEVTQQLTRTDICRAVGFTWFAALDGLPVPMGHAGALETACLLAIDDSLVDANSVETAARNGSDRWGDWVGGTNLAVDVDEFSDNGVVGDPTTATEAMGEELLERSIDQLVTVISELRARRD